MYITGSWVYMHFLLRGPCHKTVSIITVSNSTCLFLHFIILIQLMACNTSDTHDTNWLKTNKIYILRNNPFLLLLTILKCFRFLCLLLGKAKASPSIAHLPFANVCFYAVWNIVCKSTVYFGGALLFSVDNLLGANNNLSYQNNHVYVLTSLYWNRKLHVNSCISSAIIFPSKWHLNRVSPLHVKFL